MGYTQMGACQRKLRGFYRAGGSCAPARGKNANGIGKGVADGTALPVASGVMVGGSVWAHKN